MGTLIEKTEQIEEFDLIRLTVPLEGEDVFDSSVIHPLPIGSVGTAVHVHYRGGKPSGFETEFLIHQGDSFRSVQIPVDASQCVLHQKYEETPDEEPEPKKKESAKEKKAREAKEYAEAAKAFADAETVTKANIMIPDGSFVVGMSDLEVKRAAVKFARLDPPIANLTETFLEGTPPEKAYGMPLTCAFVAAFEFVRRYRLAKNNWPPKELKLKKAI